MGGVTDDPADDAGDHGPIGSRSLRLNPVSRPVIVGVDNTEPSRDSVTAGARA